MRCKLIASADRLWGLQNKTTKFLILAASIALPSSAATVNGIPSLKTLLDAADLLRYTEGIR